MNQRISELMDGELFEDEVGEVLDLVRHETSLRKHWAAYHLIGDVLRQPDYIHCDLSGKVRERMSDEPVILVPQRFGTRYKVRNFALSAAASLSAVGVVVWMSMQISPETSPQMAMQQSPIRPASVQMQPQSNDYLLAHQEFSSGIDINGSASYIRTVSYMADENLQKNIPKETRSK